MVVYVETLEDYNLFLRGQWVIMSKMPLKQYYKKINILLIEIRSEDKNSVIVEKMI